jgi:rhamnose utilization protein RhaD (predicted bifunctional aldolase and dehydrogenase)
LKLAWLAWKRPGFELGLWLEQTVRDNRTLMVSSSARTESFTWGKTGRESYLNTLRVIDGIGQFILKRVEAKGDQLFGGAKWAARDDRYALAMEVMPILRGQVGNVLGHFIESDEVLRFVNSERAQAWRFREPPAPTTLSVPSPPTLCGVGRRQR